MFMGKALNDWREGRLEQQRRKVWEKGRKEGRGELLQSLHEQSDQIADADTRKKVQEFLKTSSEK